MALLEALLSLVPHATNAPPWLNAFSRAGFLILLLQRPSSRWRRGYRMLCWRYRRLLQICCTHERPVHLVINISVTVGELLGRRCFSSLTRHCPACLAACLATWQYRLTVCVCVYFWKEMFLNANRQSLSTPPPKKKKQEIAQLTLYRTLVEASNLINDPKCNKGSKCNKVWP